ncbi:hypothetical protein DVR12_19175 [Chitinophaga silvatica]|uniref:PKD-like family protein n=1 Tax=Chitinophaga silvatica TaxID=2282649 RepID=A0A3E1Y7G8_9BACT|nr:PKD-like family lipoprotein [Chitinophaga silvatica]RFS20683.1 hypothetical protein DVR12_19175 [Chitinophaga silvatica]
MKLFKNKFLLGLACILMLAACYKDKGNYRYTDINNIQLSDTTSYTVLQFDTLKIQPQLKQSLPVNQNQLKYEWTARAIDPNLASQHFDVYTLSDKQNLDTVISLVPGQYRLIYKVTDNNTAISSYLFYDLKVGTNLSEGWMFVQQYAGSGDVSLLSPTGRMFHHIYEASNGSPLPADLQNLDINRKAVPNEIYLMTGNQGLEVSPTSFAKVKQFSNWFFNLPAVEKPMRNLVFTETSTSVSAGIFINNGLVHIKRYGGFPGDVLYGAELLLDGKTSYAAAPVIMTGDFNTNRYMAVFYDTKGKRFVGLRGPTYDITANMVHLPDSVDGTPFDANKVGLDFVYAGPTSNNYEYNTVLKDAGTGRYLFQLNLATAAAAKRKQLMNAPDIANATAFVSSLQLDYLYYAAGNKIYLYEVGPNSATQIFSLPAGEAVTAMSIDANYSKSTMMVGTYDGNKGRAYNFKLTVNGLVAGDSAYRKYDGFGKIIQMKYK